jgi:hypothetical protein
MPLSSYRVGLLLVASLANAGCAVTSPAVKPALVPALPYGQWAGELILGHPLATAEDGPAGRSYIVIQNCEAGLATYSRVKGNEYVRARQHTTLEHRGVTFMYSLAASKAHPDSWREVRAVTLFPLPDKRLHLSLRRSVVNPTEPPDSGMVSEYMAVGRLDFSEKCAALPMAARQLAD